MSVRSILPVERDGDWYVLVTDEPAS
jgi:hypothetical protein